MLRKPSHKRIKAQRRKEMKEFLSSPSVSTIPPHEDQENLESLENDDQPSGSGRFFYFKKKVMKSRLGKSLSRLEQRRSSLGKTKKPHPIQKESHSAIEYLSHENSSQSTSQQDLALS